MTLPIHNLTDKNKFICAAIMWEDWNMYLWARHHHCFIMLRNAWVKQVDHNSQWFMLWDGSFIDRYDGQRIEYIYYLLPTNTDA